MAIFTTALPLLLFAIAVGAFALGVARFNELFAFRILDGALLVLRGKPPARLLADLGDIVATAPPLRHGTFRITVEGGRAMLRASADVPAVRLQRMRNVVGMWPLARLRSR